MSDEPFDQQKVIREIKAGKVQDLAEAYADALGVLDPVDYAVRQRTLLYKTVDLLLFDHGIFLPKGEENEPR